MGDVIKEPELTYINYAEQPAGLKKGQFIE
jgi:hypothetical protein